MSQNDFVDESRRHFDAVADRVLNSLQGGESATLNLNAEESLFIRFNRTKVRQNTNVKQLNIDLQLQKTGRTSKMRRTLTGNVIIDCEAMLNLLKQCRAELSILSNDPHQVEVKNNGGSDETFRGTLLPSDDVFDAVLGSANGLDMAGLYSAGSIVRANRNSKGQQHWFSTQNFLIDYSLYNGARAVKGRYLGTHWDQTQWTLNLIESKNLLALMALPFQSVKADKYRTYMAPGAVAELAGIMGWNALSGSAWMQGRSPFKKLADKECRLSPQLHISDDFSLGFAPRFNEFGEISEQTVPLITAGELSSLLINSRTAKEFGLKANGANESENPRSLSIAPGYLEDKDILIQLGTGLYLSNLHYLNWSDPVSASVTGMTRYACFWVEDGEIVGPIKDMRWDESLYAAFGEKLMALTKQTYIHPSLDTYFQRALGGTCTPGALIDNFTFT